MITALRFYSLDVPLPLDVCEEEGAVSYEWKPKKVE